MSDPNPSDTRCPCSAPGTARAAGGGFTLIEMMITVAIVGVLAAIAVPTYLNYVTRAKVSEGLALAGPVKTAVAEYYSIHGALPQVANNNWSVVLNVLGLPNDSDSGAGSGQHVKRIWWYNNATDPSIRIKYAGGLIDDKRVYLKADISAGSIRWECTTPAPSKDGLPERYLPASCR